VSKRIFQSFLDLIYPPLCLHCNAALGVHYAIFCEHCTQLLHPIAPNERCPYCFSADLNVESEKCCQNCRQKTPSTDRMAAVFDYEGPAASFVKHFKYGGQSYLAKGAGAYLVMQFLELNWPMPDCVIPMPMAPLRLFERGYNQSVLLAEEVALLLNRPMHNILQRCGGDFSQAGLNHQQRLELRSEAFSVKAKVSLYDQTVLLIDDVMTTGSSLRCCAEVLQELCPQHIYALTLCRAL